MKRILTAAVFALTVAGAWEVRADYPVASHRYLADPASLVHGGRVYLYCSNDDENPVGGGYTMKSLVCVSSSDLKNWTDHGVVFSVPANASWAGFAWAPALIARNGRIYLYFGNNASGIGVASSVSPIGPFHDAKGGYLVNSATPGVLPATSMWIFDPAVFIDDDGQAYLYFGGNGINNARVIRLNADMVSTSGSAVTISTPNFFEAAWMHKRNGTYYFSYSSNPSSGLTIDYLTSTDPMSGFTHRGTVAPQPPSNNNNNHHAIFSLGGNWYHAYHNRYVANQAGIPPGYRRNLALEKLEYNADGTIKPVVYTTDGLAQLASLDPYRRVEGETTNAQHGLETEPCSEGGMNATFTQDGAWLRVRGVDFGAGGAAEFTARLATTAGGSLEIRIGSVTGTLAGTLAVPSTGGAQAWASRACPVSGLSGVQDLYLVFKGAAAATLNLDWWRFVPAAPVVQQQPGDKVVFPGGVLTLAVEAAGGALAYQWFRDGVAVAGQTRDVLWIDGATSAHSGGYTAQVTGGAGGVTTRSAAVLVSPEASRLVNMSCRIQLNAGQLVSPGFSVVGSGSKQVLIRVAGPALADFGLSTAMADPQLRVYRGGTLITQNDNWDAAAIGDAFARVQAFGFTPGSRDAAVLVTLAAGQTYTAEVSGVGSSSGLVLLEVYDADGGAATSRLVNVSVRGTAATGAASLVLGFVVAGSGERTLLIRGAGPALTAFGVVGVLADPQLIVYDAASAPRLANNGWARAESPAAIAAAGNTVQAFPFATNSADAAVLARLAPGLYTVHAASITGSTGEALAEVYEVP